MEPKRERAPVPPLDPRAIVIMRRMAGEFAERYADEFLLTHLKRLLGLPDAEKSTVASALEDPFLALKAFFGHYAFARRGKDREDLAHGSLESMNRLVADRSFEDVLEEPDGTSLWTAFDKYFQEKKLKSNEQQNRGPIQGMLELAQEIHKIDNSLSLATWVTAGATDTGRLEPQHLRIVDIRGVGPKSASTFVRDMVWLYDVEDDVDPADRLFTQPVDRWLRNIVRYVVPEPGLEDPADWIVAGKISKYTRRAQVSGIQFNMGTTYFGQRVVIDPNRFEDALRSLLVSEIERAKSTKPSD